MKSMKEYLYWFVVGSQDLYGPEVLYAVDAHAQEMAQTMDARVCGKLTFKGVMKRPEEITSLVKDANYDDNCAGIITWMHTFSPSKMWINGLKILKKPMLHLHTQYESHDPGERHRYGFYEPESGGARRP